MWTCSSTTGAVRTHHDDGDDRRSRAPLPASSLTPSQRPPPAKTRRAPGSCATALVSGARTLTTRSSRDRDGKASRPPTPSGRKISTAASWASLAAATGSARRPSHLLRSGRLRGDEADTGARGHQVGREHAARRAPPAPVQRPRRQHAGVPAGNGLTSVPTRAGADRANRASRHRAG